jgi:peptidoglycan biosynthesis protein MviN/MurJ (putative lipid II flippase)
MMLVTVGMILLFGFSDLVPLLLFDDNVTGDNQALLGKLLRFYAIAITTVVLFLVAGSGLLAARRAKIYAAYGALACVVSIILLIILFPKIGVVAIPLGLAISHSLAASLMLRAIHPADFWKVVVGAGTRLIVILVAGSAIHRLDVAIAERFGLAEHLAAGVLISIMLTGVWWIVEQRLSRRLTSPVQTI